MKRTILFFAISIAVLCTGLYGYLHSSQQAMTAKEGPAEAGLRTVSTSTVTQQKVKTYTEAEAIAKITSELADPDYQKLCGLSNTGLTFTSDTSVTAKGNTFSFIGKDEEGHVNFFDVEFNTNTGKANVGCNAMNAGPDGN